MNNYPIVPGRGLNTEVARRARLFFLQEQGIEIPLLANSGLEPEQIRHNLESYIGSIEIPLGLAGPLLLDDEVKKVYIYAPVGTLEGALVASMNRGAKVISQSGGVKTFVLHQRMVRSPMYIFREVAECLIFKAWVEQQYESIKAIAEQYSNHAKLIDLQAQIAGRSVHLKFVYTTGDASGQNMTTTCTAHAMRWINQHFQAQGGPKPLQSVIEGNAASDKKVSHFSISHGRGIHVVAECRLKSEVIEKVLRVSPEDLVQCMGPSRIMSNMDGMQGYNINVANAIAAIFVATGQDLASIHESGVGILHLEKTADGLYCALHLPSLVIGTVGGGTQLPQQQEALRMIGCAGQGKVARLAQVIAGFALALELSTFAAIVGGQFAKAHEKIGRNKPVDWLVKAEIDQAFLQKSFICPYREQVASVSFLQNEPVTNGLIIQLTSRVNQKLTGFVPLQVQFDDPSGTSSCTKKILLKSKPLDLEVYQGLHYMAASIDPALADLIQTHQEDLEFKDCHLKEIELYRFLQAKQPYSIPTFFGSYVDPKREIYTLCMEFLQKERLILFNSENQPQLWDTASVKSAIRTISNIHQLLSGPAAEEITIPIPLFEPWKAKDLYTRFADILALEYADMAWRDLPRRLSTFIEQLESRHQNIQVPKTIIHNDFNPRNVAVRETGDVCIYDWELAMYNFPHRDIVEFLSFVLPTDFTTTTLLQYLEYHYSLQTGSVTWPEWEAAYSYALQEFLVTRASFYLTGKILMDYSFAERIFLNAFRMLDLLSATKS